MTALVCRSINQPSVRVAIRVDCEQTRACGLVEGLADDVWSEHGGPGIPLDVVVTSDVLPLLEEAGVRWTVLVPDIDEAARVEAQRLRTASPTEDWFSEYRDFNAITARMRELAELAPDRVTMHAIGTSLENRTLWALRIGSGPKPMLINGTQHAREWLATMTTTCIADRLVREYDTNAAIRAFADATTLWVVPVVNPDGYQYSW